MPDETTPWVVKGVSMETRRKVKVYAAQHDMTMAQAVEALINGYMSPQLRHGLSEVYNFTLARDFEQAYQAADVLQERIRIASLRGGTGDSINPQVLDERLRALDDESPDE